MENYLKGDAYEKYTKNILLTNNDQVYLWNDIPIDIFINCNIFDSYDNKLRFRRGIKNDKHNVSDTGCDIFYFSKIQNKWVIVQCKNYIGTITQEKLAGFYGLLLSTGLNGELFYTSSLSEPITRYKQPKIEFIKHEFMQNQIVNKKYVKMTPYDYQLDAYNSLKDKQRAILQLPCGMGKTLIGIMWGKLFDLIIIFSPLKQHAAQNLERFKNEIDNYDQYILVDSDGNRDIDYIKRSVNKKSILSVTYKSVDIIEQLLEFIPANKKVGIIVDEFHNLNYDNVMSKDDQFYKVLSAKFNYLFISATPRLFDSDDDYVNNEAITGKIEYTYDFGKAIKNGYICDYDVFVPDISITKEVSMQNVYTELKLSDKTNIDHDIKAHFLIRSMDENGHSKCICYSKDVEDATKLMESFNRVKEYHAIDLYIKVIVSETSQKERAKILSEFADTKSKAIICSVRILDECIDIPACDCVFMTSVQSNKIRTVQRICRANRKNKENPNKKAGVYVWSDAYDQLVQLITNLKEFDDSFTKEKVKICNIANEKIKCVTERKDKDELYIILDKIIFNIKKIETWSELYEKVKKYIDINKCKPNKRSYDENIKKMGIWIANQQLNFMKRQKIMKSNEIYCKWNDFIKTYKRYFNSNEELWIVTLTNLREYINEHKKRPTKNSDNNAKILSQWISDQQNNAETRTKIMKSDKIFNIWNEFIELYKEYFKSNKEQWEETFEKTKQYIYVNKCRPSTNDNNEHVRFMGRWICAQQLNYDDKIFNMKSEEIYNKWTKFIEQNKQYFISDVEHWYEMFDKIKFFIEKNNRKPTPTDDKQLCKWLYRQKENIKNKKDCMKNDKIFNTWNNFIKEKNKYIMNNNEKWQFILNEVKDYLNENNKRPPAKSQLGGWIEHQQSNYKKNVKIMKSTKIRDEWEKFIKENCEHFKT